MFYHGGMADSQLALAAGPKPKTDQSSKQMTFEVRPIKVRRAPKWVKEPLVKGASRSDVHY